MTWPGWVALALAILVAVLAVVRMRVRSRSEGLNTEVIRTGAMLDRSLRARARMALDLAHSPHVDPATAVILGDIASRCLEDEALGEPALEAGTGEAEGRDRLDLWDRTEMRERALAESELTRGLRVIVPQLAELGSSDPGLAHHLERLMDRWRLVGVARTLHNSRVAQALEVRHSFPGRLSGVRAPVAVTFDMDDALPEGSS
ncbi:MAG: hypothetical protein Q4G64_04655 [bacterium]|nr:hypothetical protein [bacterium]